MNKRFEYKLYTSDDTVIDTVNGNRLTIGECAKMMNHQYEELKRVSEMNKSKDDYILSLDEDIKKLLKEIEQLKEDNKTLKQGMINASFSR